MAEPRNETMPENGFQPGKERPLVTFMVAAYNHEKFVRQAMESAIAQTYRPIQFIFSDDCSSDRTFEIMREVAAKYKDKEDILLNRNEKNLGVANHFNKLFIELAEGKYLVALAGDDMTTPDRTEKVVACFEATGASAVASNPVMIDEEGVATGKRLYPDFPTGILHFEEYFVKCARFFGGGGYARDLFDVYGPMKSNARNEDRILPCRASTLGGIAYLDEPVHLYREHGGNFSFWVKIKRDPMNRAEYLASFKKNELQNLANFIQEIEDSYRGADKDRILSEVSARYDVMQLELELSTAGFLPQWNLLPVALRVGRSIPGTLRLLLACMSPKLYRLIQTIKRQLR